MKNIVLTIYSICICTSLISQANVKEQKVKISTVFGDMIVKLYNDTPVHRDNFIKNVKEGAYDGTLFHRVIPYFMIQGGDSNSKGASPEQVLGSDRCGQIPSEIRTNRFHKKGALAAARLPDAINQDRKSSSCQFFIVHGYKLNDAQLDNMETDTYKFPDVNRAYYKTRGGYPPLDMQYTIFGEVIEGLEIIDLITSMPTGKYVKDRPNTDVPMTVTLIE